MTAFVDTNVLLYSISIVPGEAAKRRIALDVLESMSCVFSVQVFNEFVWRSTKASNPSSILAATARRLTDAWRRFPVQPIDEALFDHAWDVASRTNYTWWDCLIIAAARSAGCKTLLSEDMQHGHVIDGLRIENPFRDLG